MVRSLLGFAFGMSVVAAMALPTTAQAQSFNCRYSKHADEVLICQTPRLAVLDERMSGIFFQLRNRLYGARLRRLDADQAAWLQRRTACGRDADCIETAYLERIRELSE